MDFLSIILMVACAILSIALALVVSKRKQETSIEPSDEISTKSLDESKLDESAEIDRLNKIISEKDLSIEKLQAENLEAQKKTETILFQLREKNTKSLEEAAQRIAELEKEISKAIDGGTDEVIKQKLADADKLLKKIKVLEDDLEEAEDEVDNLKKKNKNLQSEKDQLQEDLDNEIRKQKKLINDINEIKLRLEKVEKDFAIREEALDFVKEILTADITQDESVRHLYQSVDNIVDYIKGEVRDCLTSIYELDAEQKKNLFDSELMSWAISKKKKWIQGKTSVAFVGEFSAGKTSIVNRILSQDDPNVPLLPVSTKATTAIPTYISGGNYTVFQFVTPDNELKGISESTFKRVNKDVLDQVKGVSSLIQYFVMTYKNPHLDKLSILDTPGFNSNDAEDAERTIGVINECDALFWVFDVNAGTVNRSSIKIIKENLTKPLYIVINQIDTKSKSDVDAVEKLIRKTLQDEGIAINTVIRFSKKEPLSNIMDPILRIRHDSSREAYLDDLISLLSNRLKELAADTKEAQKKSNKLENKSSRLVDTYNEAIRSLQEDCIAVSEIPQYNSRLFSKDDYRISQEQYDEFISILQEISESHSVTLCEQYDEQMDTVAEMQVAWADHAEAKFNQKRLKECLEALQKRASQLGKPTTSNARQEKKKANIKSGSDTHAKTPPKQESKPSKQASKTIVRDMNNVYTSDEILKKFTIQSRIDSSKGFDEEVIKVNWNELYNFSQNTLRFDIPKDVFDKFRKAREYERKDRFCNKWDVTYGLGRLFGDYLLENDINSCSINESLNINVIKDSDINWDSLLMILKSLYNTEIEKWQIFSSATEKQVNLSTIIDRIHCKLPDNFPIYPYKQ